MMINNIYTDAINKTIFDDTRIGKMRDIYAEDTVKRNDAKRKKNNDIMKFI